MSVAPAYGLAYVVPDDAIAAWGARLIVTQQGDVDFLPDRQGSDGGEHSRHLMNLLGERFPLPTMRQLLRTLLRGTYMHDGAEGHVGLEKVQMHTREADDFILHLDDRLVVHANTNASAGYCYVTAWLYPTNHG